MRVFSKTAELFSHLRLTNHDCCAIIYRLYRKLYGCALSSADRVPGYEPVGREFESPRARHVKNLFCLPDKRGFFE